jgi:putative tryptophan/tyrosine transport system substrate-binding protein
VKRREFITLLGGGAASWPLAARAQQPDRMRRVGVLMSLAADGCGGPGPPRGVRTGSAAIGLDHRPQRANRLPLERSRCRSHPQIRGRIGRACARRHPGHQQPGHGSPAAGNPHRADCVYTGRRSSGQRFRSASLAQPGGNATGFTVFEYGISVKWLELLKEIAPRVTRVAVLRDATIAGRMSVSLVRHCRRPKTCPIAVIRRANV